MHTILAFSGGLRKGSFNTGLIRAAISLAPENMKIVPVEFSWLPPYNADMEAQFPAEITELKNKIRAADGILIATPEYNRSVPGALKNMFDWTSRPYGDEPWKGKPVAIMGATTGQVGTAVAQSHLRTILAYLDARVVGQPEFYVSMARDKFDAEVNLTDEKTKEKIVKLLGALEKLIALK